MKTLLLSFFTLLFVSAFSQAPLWTKEQLMPTKDLAEKIKTNAKDKPIIFNCGPMENIKTAVFVGRATSATFSEKIKSTLSMESKTKAIVVVHLYGRVAWSEELEAMKKEGKYLILEDNAQAIGATWKGRKTGSLGHAAAFSFYPGKNLGALGDGGAVSTNDTELADMVKALSSYGSRVKYVHELKGVNSRLDEMQAALLRVKLRYVDWENQKRKDVARMYVKHFKNDNIILPEIPADEDEHVWHLFVLRVKNREAFREHMEDHGVMTLIHYPIAPHKQAAYKELAHLNLPISEQLHEEVVSLPISQIMSVDQVYQVLKACEQFSK